MPSQQQHGFELFAGAAGCSDCHRVTGSPALFTDTGFHSTLISPQFAAKLPGAAMQVVQDYPDAAVPGGKIASDAVVSELGRYLVTRNPQDIDAFRTPSRRNVALTAPYMHDGSVATLRDAVDREIYYRSLQSNRPNTLTEQDRKDIVAFPDALTSTSSQ